MTEQKLTKSDKPEKLTDKQAVAIPFLVCAHSVDEGCEAAKISRTTYYEWIKTEPFKEALSEAREQMIYETLESVKGFLPIPIKKLQDLINDDAANRKDLSFQALREYLNLLFKILKNEELKNRVKALEKKVDELVGIEGQA